MDHFRLPNFEPSRKAALSQIKSVDPILYASTRNFLGGAVTCLSPWLTHGFTNTREVAQLVNTTHSLSFEDKLVFELGWREFFKHVHEHLGQAILQDIRRPVGSGYKNNLPEDIKEARTGLIPIDQSIRTLYATGYLHNHARLWLASYIVHLRKVHWRVGADWMYGHLLDGDLASNHLSWQWVAGTFSTKPYLFNAANVAKFAPQWDASNTGLDRSYEELGDIANSRMDIGPERGASREPGIDEPETLSLPKQPNRNWARLGKDIPLAELGQRISTKEVMLVHPWALAHAEAQPEKPEPARVGIIDLAFHETFPWSQRRWDFVCGAMGKLAQILIVDSRQAAEVKALRDSLPKHTYTLSTENPGYADLISLLECNSQMPETILPPLDHFRGSFSSFYRKSTERAIDLQSVLLDLSEATD